MSGRGNYYYGLRLSKKVGWLARKKLFIRHPFPTGPACARVRVPPHHLSQNGDVLMSPLASLAEPSFAHGY